MEQPRSYWNGRCQNWTKKGACSLPSGVLKGVCVCRECKGEGGCIEASHLAASLLAASLLACQLAGVPVFGWKCLLPSGVPLQKGLGIASEFSGCQAWPKKQSKESALRGAGDQQDHEQGCADTELPEEGEEPACSCRWLLDVRIGRRRELLSHPPGCCHPGVSKQKWVKQTCGSVVDGCQNWPEEGAIVTPSGVLPAKRVLVWGNWCEAFHIVQSPEFNSDYRCVSKYSFAQACYGTKKICVCLFPETCCGTKKICVCLFPETCCGTKKICVCLFRGMSWNRAVRQHVNLHHFGSTSGFLAFDQGKRNDIRVVVGGATGNPIHTLRGAVFQSCNKKKGWNMVQNVRNSWTLGPTIRTKRVHPPEGAEEKLMWLKHVWEK